MPGAVIAGFYGKLPARGDFVRAGLPRDFTDPWDDWLQTVVAGSRALMGEAWLPAFLEAPVWRFTLPRGMCGPQTPTVDGNPCGVFSWQPPAALVSRLSDVLDRGPER